MWDQRNIHAKVTLGFQTKIRNGNDELAPGIGEIEFKGPVHFRIVFIVYFLGLCRAT